MRNQLRKKISLTKQLYKMLAIITVFTTLNMQVFADTTSASTANLSNWAKGEVVSYLGSSYNSSVNYRYPISRSEFAQSLYTTLTNLGADWTKVTPATLSDTSDISAQYIVGAGIIPVANVLNPSQKITREEMAYMIVKACEFTGVPLQESGKFYSKDMAEVRSDYLQYVDKAFSSKVINGNGTYYSPKEYVTREQMYAVMSRTINTYLRGNSGSTPPNGSTIIQNPANQKGYTYDSATGKLTVTGTAIFDGTVANAVKSYKTVEVKENANATFKKVTIDDLTIAKGGTVTVEAVTISSVTSDNATFVGDDDSKLTKFISTGTLDLQASEMKIKTLTLKETKTDKAPKVSVEADVTSIVVDGTYTLTLEGDFTDLDINEKDTLLEFYGSVTTMNVTEPCEINAYNYSEISKLNIEAKTKFTSEKRTKLGTIKITTEGKNSTFEILSDVTFAHSTDIYVNKIKVSKGDTVTYKDGDLTINGILRDDDEDEDDAEDADLVQEYIRDEGNILRFNSSLNNITEDMYLPTARKNASISWNSSNKAVVSDLGVVVRPVTDTIVTLTATIKVDSAIRTVKHTVTVKAKADTAVETYLKALLEQIPMPTTIATGTTTVSLPTTFGGEVVTWTSSFPLVISTTGVVTTPQEVTNVTLEATMTKSGTSAKKQFTIRVDSLAPVVTPNVTIDRFEVDNDSKDSYIKVTSTYEPSTASYTIQGADRAELHKENLFFIKVGESYVATSVVSLTTTSSSYTLLVNDATGVIATTSALPTTSEGGTGISMTSTEIWKEEDDEDTDIALV